MKPKAVGEQHGASRSTSVAVIIPTYMENENIALLVPELIRVLSQVPRYDFNIIIADDESPDGTPDTVLRFAEALKNVWICSGEKRGLGCAYLRAFEYVRREFDAEVIIMMDADLSHPPKLIPTLLDCIEEGYDVVIGCRYMKGGGTPDWSWDRRILSRLGNLAARTIGRIRQVRDCTSGFRAIRTAQLDSVRIDKLHTRGYAFLTTLLFELARSEARIKEVPLMFRDRRFGETKLDKRDILEFGVNAIRLQMISSVRMIKFAVVGFTGVLVNLGVLFLLVELFGFDRRMIAPAISLELSIVSNFLLNDSWTFMAARGSGGWFRRFSRFHVAALAGFFLNLGIYNLVLAGIASRLGGYDYLIAQAIAIVFVFGWNYLVSCQWTWRNESGLGGERAKVAS